MRVSNNICKVSENNQGTMGWLRSNPDNQNTLQTIIFHLNFRTEILLVLQLSQMDWRNAIQVNDASFLV